MEIYYFIFIVSILLLYCHINDNKYINENYSNKSNNLYEIPFISCNNYHQIDNCNQYPYDNYLSNYSNICDIKLYNKNNNKKFLYALGRTMGRPRQCKKLL